MSIQKIYDLFSNNKKNKTFIKKTENYIELTIFWYKEIASRLWVNLCNEDIKEIENILIQENIIWSWALRAYDHIRLKAIIYFISLSKAKFTLKQAKHFSFVILSTYIFLKINGYHLPFFYYQPHRWKPL